MPTTTATGRPRSWCSATEPRVRLPAWPRIDGLRARGIGARAIDLLDGRAERAVSLFAALLADDSRAGAAERGMEGYFAGSLQTQPCRCFHLADARHVEDHGSAGMGT
jgi:hypothetical protein